MDNPAHVASPDGLLNVSQTPTSTGTTFVVEVANATASSVLAALFPTLGRMIREKTSAVRERQLGEVIDFMAEKLVSPSPVAIDMALRVAERRARLLNEFGAFTAEQLADINNSASPKRGSMADNWRKRRRVFAVPQPGSPAGERDVYPRFQFDGDGKPLKVIQEVVEAFGDRKDPWKLALWFASSNGMLPESARPVDLLRNEPAMVTTAALHDAQGSGV